jgi:hypothetical protein
MVLQVQREMQVLQVILQQVEPQVQLVLMVVQETLVLQEQV